MNKTTMIETTMNKTTPAGETVPESASTKLAETLSTELAEWPEIMGDLDLRNYPHQLPAGLTTTGDLDLEGYAHQLPAGLTKRAQ